MKTATSLLALAVAAPLTATAAAADLTRLASVPVGAEITGMYLTEGGDFFFNLQHPSTAITGPFNKATVGIVVDADFNSLPGKFIASPVPGNGYAKQTVQTAVGTYQVLAQQGDFAETVPGGLGAIHAAAGQMTDADFLGGIDRFTNMTGAVENHGEIRAGEVHLAGRRVTNLGAIVAPEGLVTMSVGDRVLVGEHDGHVFVSAS